MDDVATPQEGVPDKQTGVPGQDAMANVEGIIDHLSERGLIDQFARWKKLRSRQAR